MLEKRTIKDTKVKNQNVLVRVDYNVPMEDGKITDDLRIRASLPTIKYLIENGARRIILISHLGRPEGKRVKELSLAPVAQRLAELLPENKVSFIDDISGPDVEEAVQKLPVGGILLLENLRFFPGEEQNSAEFAREIAGCTGADLFVQDGFAVIHRAHASTDAITKELPSVAGFLVDKEVSALSKVATSPAHPFVIVIGGAKVADKQPLIDKLSPLADAIFVGGKIAADGYTSDNPKIHVCDTFKEDGEGGKRDIGEPCIEALLNLVQNAKTVLWNGTLGEAEKPEFAEGSEKLADFLGSHPEITTIICGGDTAGFAENYLKSHQNLRFSLISTGGGASLELLSGLDLPGLDSLDDRI
ncbi:phosphoglycerate kinase [Candidatus Saccharibacteria bacterium]|nr:phosphoglycerate kinase [Candidatus Saccharibacteria bacterium]